MAEKGKYKKIQGKKYTRFHLPDYVLRGLAQLARLRGHKSVQALVETELTILVDGAVKCPNCKMILFDSQSIQSNEIDIKCSSCGHEFTYKKIREE
jgi:DNA-directed RNA polymerase subunit RPC12/RpoP